MCHFLELAFGKNTVLLLQCMSAGGEQSRFLQKKNFFFDLWLYTLNNTYYRNKLGRVNRTVEHFCNKAGGYTIHCFLIQWNGDHGISSPSHHLSINSYIPSKDMVGVVNFNKLEKFLEKKMKTKLNAYHKMTTHAHRPLKNKDEAIFPVNKWKRR